MTSIYLITSFGVLFLLTLVLLGIVWGKYQALKAKLKVSQTVVNQSIADDKKDRELLVKELHDGLHSDLIAIRNFVFICSQLKEGEEQQELFLKIAMALDNSISDTKQLTQKLIPIDSEHLQAMP